MFIYYTLRSWCTNYIIVFFLLGFVYSIVSFCCNYIYIEYSYITLWTFVNQTVLIYLSKLELGLLV